MLADGMSTTMEVTLLELELATADDDIVEDGCVVVVVVVGPPFALAQDDQSELAVGQPADAYHELHAAESVTVGVGCALVQLCQSEFVVQSPPPVLLPYPRHGPPPGPPVHEPEVGMFLPLVALKVACWDAVGVWPALAQPCAMTW